MTLSARVVLLTFVGGALGTIARWSIGLAIESSFWAVALVNIAGAFAIGFFNGHRSFHTDARRAFFSVGLCGGFTTLSALMATADSGLAGVGVAAEFALGIGVYLLGRRTGDSSSAETAKEADLV